MADDDTENPASERRVTYGAGGKLATESPPSGTSRREISRRSVLGSLAAIGATGAVSSSATRALLTDEVVFGGNSGNGGKANTIEAGELDFEHCWERDGEDCTPSADTTTLEFGDIEEGSSESATLRCAVQDNPGWVWFRTGCPTDPCGLEAAMEVTLWFDESGDTAQEGDNEQIVEVDGEPIEEVSLCQALSLLNQGVLLDGRPGTETVTPLDPDDTLSIGFEWEVTEPICGDEDDLDVTIEFYAEQARNNSTPTNPFEPDDCPDCDVECPECEDPRTISFVAFCLDNDDGTIEADDLSFTPYYRDGESIEPYRLDWTWLGETTDGKSPLCSIVLKYGTTFHNFDVDGATSGTVATNSNLDGRVDWYHGQGAGGDDRENHEHESQHDGKRHHERRKKRDADFDQQEGYSRRKDGDDRPDETSRGGRHNDGDHDGEEHDDPHDEDGDHSDHGGDEDPEQSPSSPCPDGCGWGVKYEFGTEGGWERLRGEDRR